MSRVIISVEEESAGQHGDFFPIIVDANKKVAAEQLTVWLARNKAPLRNEAKQVFCNDEIPDEERKDLW